MHPIPFDVRILTNRQSLRPRMVLAITPFLALAVSFSPASATAQSCESAFNLNATTYGSNFELAAGLDGQFRPTQGTLFEVLRANAPHQMKSLIEEKQNKTIQELIKVKGTIIGDFHLLNLGDIELQNHSRKIGLVDIDDGGVNAPLIADITRAIIGANSSELNISMDAAMSAYLGGLKGTKSTKPKLVSDAEAATAEDFLSKQEEWIDKITSDKKFNGKSKVESIGSSPSQFQKLFGQVQSELVTAIGSKKVFDFGFRAKISGGSQGLPRFWFLVQNKQMPKSLEAIEFKFLGRPASDLSSPQPDPATRVAELIKTFRPAEALFGEFKVVKTSGGYFLMRTRLKNFIEPEVTAEMSPTERKLAADYYLFLINRLGLNHKAQLSTQPKLLSRLLEILSQENAQSELLKWCEDYIQTIKKLNSKK